MTPGVFDTLLAFWCDKKVQVWNLLSNSHHHHFSKEPSFSWWSHDFILYCIVLSPFSLKTLLFSLPFSSLPSPPHPFSYCSLINLPVRRFWVFWKESALWLLFFISVSISYFLNSISLSNFLSSILSLRRTHLFSPWEFFSFIGGYSSENHTRHILESFKHHLSCLLIFCLFSLCLDATPSSCSCRRPGYPPVLSIPLCHPCSVFYSATLLAFLSELFHRLLFMVAVSSFTSPRQHLYSFWDLVFALQTLILGGDRSLMLESQSPRFHLEQFRHWLTHLFLLSEGGGCSIRTGGVQNLPTSLISVTELFG